MRKGCVCKGIGWILIVHTQAEDSWFFCVNVLKECICYMGFRLEKTDKTCATDAVLVDCPNLVDQYCIYQLENAAIKSVIKAVFNIFEDHSIQNCKIISHTWSSLNHNELIKCRTSSSSIKGGILDRHIGIKLCCKAENRSRSSWYLSNRPCLIHLDPSQDKSRRVGIIQSFEFQNTAFWCRNICEGCILNHNVESCLINWQESSISLWWSLIYSWLRMRHSNISYVKRLIGRRRIK